MKKILQLILMFYGLSFLPNAATTAMAQNKQPLELTLKKIEEVYGAKFVYEKNLLEGVSVNYPVQENKNKSIESVLKEVLYPKGFLFLYVEKNYFTIVRDSRSKGGNAPAGPAINDVPGAVTSPSGRITISGRITDAAGTPLPGASIKPEGSRYGISSSSDGSYSITFDKSYKTLVFSYVGLLPQRKDLDGSSRMNVVLAADDNTLKEVEVVSTGYEKLPKERTTGSFGFVSAKEIEKTPAVNLMERLQGKVPGVDFDVRSNTIHIRGVNTYAYASSGSQPLIVVDGFPLISEPGGNQELTAMGNTSATGFSLISRINPADIESITFLKDAAAASIWGASAANGVIVIETKKGKRHEPTINLSATLSISAPADLNKTNTMNSAQYINLEQELFNKGFITDPAAWSTGYYTFNTNANTSDALEWMFRVKRGTATTTQRDSALSVLSGRSNKQQIKDYLLQKAVTQQYNLSLSGGGDNSTYYISANSTNDRPIYRSNVGQSTNITTNFTNDLFNKRVTITTNLNYNNTYSKVNTAANTALGTSTYGLRPYDMLVDASGNNINRYIMFRPEVIDKFTSEGYLPWTYNAIDELNYSNSIAKENRIRANVAIKAKATDWLDFDASGAYQNNTSETVNEDEQNSYNARTLINTGTSISSTGKLVYGVPLGGIYRTTNFSGNDYSIRGNFNVHKDWNGVNQFNMIGGIELRQTIAKSYGQTRYGFNDDTYTSTSVNPTDYYQTVYPYTTYLGATDGTVTLNQRRYISYFSNASYTYLGKYTATGSLRYEDYTQAGASSSLTGKPLFSAGLKWNAKKEDFLQQVKPISTLDFRVTYGSGGSIPSGGYNTTVISISGQDANTGKPYASISSPANDKLSWELTKQLNAGMDLGMFSNRLNLNFDVYSKKSSGILYNLPYDATYGYSTLYYNAANLNSHGLEFGLQGAVIKKRDWGWNSNLTFSYNTNKVVDSQFPKSSNISIATSSVPINNYSLDYLFVYRWAGLDNTGQSQIYDKNGNIVKSTTGNANLTSADLKYAGRRTAPYFGGWTNDFNYKNFTLDVMMSYYLGGHFLKSSVDNYPTYAGTYSGVIGTQEDLASRWEKPGDEATTNVPGLSNINSNSITRYKYSDLLVRNASNVRLQQISLAYAVPAKVIKRTPFKTLSASLSARNLGIIWRKNKDGIDPDYINTSQYSNLPPTKNYVFGLNASF